MQVKVVFAGSWPSRTHAEDVERWVNEDMFMGRRALTWSSSRPMWGACDPQDHQPWVSMDPLIRNRRGLMGRWRSCGSGRRSVRGTVGDLTILQKDLIDYSYHYGLADNIEQRFEMVDQKWRQNHIGVRIFAHPKPRVRLDRGSSARSMSIVKMRKGVKAWQMTCNTPIRGVSKVCSSWECYERCTAVLIGSLMIQYACRTSGLTARNTTPRWSL